MVKIFFPLLFCLVFVITSCSSSKQAQCTLSDYAVYYFNNSQNTQCGEQYHDGVKLYGFGDREGQEAQREILERTSLAKARAELGRKVAGFQNKIKTNMGEVITQEEEGNRTITWFKSEFQVRLDKVSIVGQTCEKKGAGITCYSLVEMRKSDVLEQTSALLKEKDEELYQKWKSSDEYAALVSELDS